MKNEIALIPSKDDLITIQAIAKSAHESKYFDKIGGAAGVLSIALFAREMGIPPMSALFGGFSNVQGKISMSAGLMNSLIRQAGHRLDILEQTRDCCKIKGTRKDTGETCTCIFTMEDAKRAGLVKAGGAFEKYADDMLFARCISKLYRRLFPDVCGQAYVEGEIEDDKTAQIEKHVASEPVVEPVVTVAVEPKKAEPVVEPKRMEWTKDTNLISDEEAEKIERLIGDDVEYRCNLLTHFGKQSGVEYCNEFTMLRIELLPAIYESLRIRDEHSKLVKKN